MNKKILIGVVTQPTSIALIFFVLFFFILNKEGKKNA